MAEAAYVPLRPIPMKDRAGIIFLEYGELDVLDSARSCSWTRTASARRSRSADLPA